MMVRTDLTLVLGLGESGLAMARWLARQGVALRVADSRDVPPGVDRLRAEVPDVEIVTGRQSIAELESHFGLASAATEEAGKTAPVLNECFEGRFAGKNYLESIETGMVDIAPLTAIVAPGTQEAVEKARKRLLSRTWDVFYGPVFDQQGNLRIGRGENISDDELLARFDWFVEGVDGKIK